MQPAIVVTLAQIPVTSEFQSDRRAIQGLPLPEFDGLRKNLAVIEKKVAPLLQDNIPQSVRDLMAQYMFFNVCANSILPVELKTTIQRELNAALPLTDLMSLSTLEGMTRHSRVSAAAAKLTTSTGRQRPVLRNPYDNLCRRTRHLMTKKPEKLHRSLDGRNERHILAHLVATPEFVDIHCLARKQSLAAFSCSSLKVHLVTANLAQPGLSRTGWNKPPWQGRLTSLLLCC